MARFGAAALLDRESHAYRQAGLAHLALEDDQIVGRLLAQPALLRLPLVRAGRQLLIGYDEPALAGLLNVDSV